MNAYTIPNSLKSFHFQSVVIGYRSKAINASVLTAITFNLAFVFVIGKKQLLQWSAYAKYFSDTFIFYLTYMHVLICVLFY